MTQVGRFRAVVCLLAVAIGVSVVDEPALARQRTASAAVGVIEGRVVDDATGEALPGARVSVTGRSEETASDASGIFRLPGVPSGDQKIVVTYVGRSDQFIDVTVNPSAISRVDVRMKLLGFEESVSVQASLIRDAEERALNRQKTAPNITNVVSADRIGSFPDRNAAETTQRVPGISISKDQGEGRYVIVRGTEPRLNSMMIDGQRIPSPDPLIRQVALDVVPSELLQSIEVAKAITPDMDGDSIGGSVNLVMKQAPDAFRFLGSIGGGYNQLLQTWDQNNYTLTAGRRLGGGKTGVIFSISGAETNRGNNDIEVTYTPTLGLNELNPRWYQVHRRRIGLTGAFDVRESPNATHTVRAVFNRFIDDHENRQRVRYAVGNRRIDRELRDRTHIERITSLSLNAQRLFGGAAILDYQVLGAYSDQVDPLTMTTTFRHTNITFAPNVSPTSIDPDNVQANPQNEVQANYNFNSQLRAVNFAKDRDVVGAANLRIPLASSSGVSSFFKVGVKFRDKQKGRTRTENTFTASSTLKMTDYLETGFDLRPFVDGRYDLSPYISQSLVEGIPSQNAGTTTRNHARDAEEFDGTERVTAGYALAEIYAGQKLYIMPGIRYEYTSADFTGRNVRFSPGGAWLGTDPINTRANYGSPLPAVHVKYAVTPSTNFRLAATRSLARPNYYDVVPYRAQDDSASTIALGNADLKPTQSWNVDALGEHYFSSVGVVSAGYFYKRLNDYIYSFTLQQSIGGTQYQVTQPLNGDTATLQGIELALQNQLRFLPSPFDGIGVYANYTLSDSTAHFPQHNGDSTLPGQSRHMGNLAVSYEKRGFMGRVSVNFHGSYIDVVGADNTQDRFYDTNRQLDLSLAQRVTRNLRVYVDLLNMNDALLRYYQGVPDRVLQEEHYHWSSLFGIKAEF